MIPWPHAEQLRFVTAISNLWRGDWTTETGVSDKARNWLAVAQGYHVEVALQGLDDLYQASEADRLPPLQAFRVACRSIQAFIENEARRKREVSRNEEPTFTALEIAADDDFWERAYDKARTPEDLAYRKRLRLKMSGGATVLDVVRADVAAAGGP